MGELRTNDDDAARRVRALFQALPAGAYSITRDGPGSEEEWGHDYVVDWEFAAAPTNPQACPIHLQLSRLPSGVDAWGVIFDTRRSMAARLGVRNPRFPDTSAFGTEPFVMPLPRVLSITSAVIRGRVTLRYSTFFRFLTGWQAEVATDDGIELFGIVTGVTKVRRWPRSYRYEPWT
jgi:hypothetical protein